MVKDRNGLTYGYSSEADFQIKNVEYKKNKAFFQIFKKQNEENIVNLDEFSQNNDENDIRNEDQSRSIQIYQHMLQVINNQQHPST